MEKVFEKASELWIKDGWEGMRVIGIDPGSTTMITAALLGDSKATPHIVS